LKLEGEVAQRVAEISGGIHRDEAELLAELAADVNPEHSIEIGLGYGFSAVTICASTANPKHTHTVLDPHQTSYWKGLGAANVREAGFADRFKLIEDYSYNALPALLRDGAKADLVFIDGWHTFDFVFVDLFYADKLLRPEGVVIFDDADWTSIRPVIRFAVTNLGYQVVGTLPEKKPRDPFDVKLGIEGSCIGMRKPAEPVRREIFHHQPFN
jgi:predicted O-methyltransferase YrrM